MSCKDGASIRCFVHSCFWQKKKKLFELVKIFSKGASVVIIFFKNNFILHASLINK